MPYSLYLRKSRADLEAESRGEGETLARHEKILLDLAKRLKLSVTAIHREIVSGETIAARPVMQQLLSEVEQGLWEGVLVVEIERLARGATIDQGIIAQTFKYADTKIITPMKTYNPNNELDEEFFEFGLFMSRREYKTINRRLQQGRVQSVKEGKYVGNKPPYGYRRVKLEKQKGYSLEAVPEEAEIVKLIFDLYTRSDRLGVSLICRRLNELKVPPAKGDVWVPASLQNMLRNPVYTGKVRWNSRPVRKKIVDGQMVKERPRAKPADWVLADGLHEAIIDPATFDQAQKYLAENPSRPCPLRSPVKNPLSGLIVCGICGRKMVRRPYAKKELPDTLMCPSPACANISVHLAFVEKRLLQELEAWLQEYKLNWEIEEQKRVQHDRPADLKRKALKKLDEELKNLTKQMDNIHDLLEQGVYSTDTFLERSRMISGRIAAAQKDRQTLLDELQWEQAREESQKVIIPKVERILELYRNTDDPALKNELLHEVVAKAVYTKTGKGHWSRGGMEIFELTLFPKIPINWENR
jgi:site-specific DNA recombinase